MNSPHATTLGALFFVLTIGGCSTEGTNATAPETDLTLIAPMDSTPFLAEGVSMPALHSADKVTLDSDARVIGLIIDGEARAYSIDSMSAMTNHVVNDQIKGVPVSVTYCDRTDNTRAFSVPADSDAQSISLSLGGFSQGEMQLMLNGKMYPQSSTEIPLCDFQYEVTDWESWRQTHPETLVFTGDGDGRNEQP